MIKRSRSVVARLFMSGGRLKNFDRTTILSGLLAVFLCGSASAANFMWCSPINDRTLCVFFDEGDKNFDDCHQKRWSNCEYRWNTGPLNTVAADDKDNYTFTSSDDQRYPKQGVKPAVVGKKCKKVAQCWHYWYYLKMPQGFEFRKNRTYTLTMKDLASNTNTKTFVFDVTKFRSMAVYVNQIGYSPDAPLKYAYVYQWMGSLDDYIKPQLSYNKGQADFRPYEGNEFYIINADDHSVAYRSSDFGKGLKFRQEWAIGQSNAGPVGVAGYHGAPIWECDFSELGTKVPVAPGEYRVAVEGIGCSYPFRIGREVYTVLEIFNMRGFYHQRSGPARLKEHTEYVKAPSQMPGYDGFEAIYSEWDGGADKAGFKGLPANATKYKWTGDPATSVTFPAMLESKDGWGWGGYFDAGDYDRRPMHMDIPQRLFTLYELNPKAYEDNAYNIPESGNGLPDLLDEARWVLDFHRRLKGPTGLNCPGMETTGYIHPSWKISKWYVFKENIQSTMMYAGLCAHFAHCLEIAGDPKKERDSWLQEAKKAFKLAGGGSYPVPSHPRDRARRGYAAACYYRVTGDPDALKLLKSAGNWRETRGGGFIYCLTDPDKWANYDKALRSTIRKEIINAALSDVGHAKARALRFMIVPNANFGWGSGFTPDIYQAVNAHHLLRSENDPRAKELLSYLYTTVDFFWGTLNENKIFCTGAHRIGGDDVCQYQLATDQAYDGIPGLIPGLFLYTINPKGPFFDPFPASELWPKYESNNDDFTPVTRAEFTVWQSILPQAVLNGYLAALNRLEISKANHRSEAKEVAHGK